jgi:bacterioferritin-associated ferredoxin
MEVTEEALIEVILSLNIRTYSQLRQHTGAGDGCMACRRRLQGYIDQYASAGVERRIPLAAAG